VSSGLFRIIERPGKSKGKVGGKLKGGLYAQVLNEEKDNRKYLIKCERLSGELYFGSGKNSKKRSLGSTRNSREGGVGQATSLKSTWSTRSTRSEKDDPGNLQFGACKGGRKGSRAFHDYPGKTLGCKN